MPTEDPVQEALDLINQASAQAEGSGTVVGLTDDVNDLLTPAQAAVRYDRSCPPPQRGVAKKKGAMTSKKRKKAGVRAIELLKESKATIAKAATKIRKAMRAR